MGNDKRAMVDVDLGEGGRKDVGTTAAAAAAAAGTNDAGMSNGDDSEENGKNGEDKKKEKQRTVGLYPLFFRYATAWDVFLMFVGTVAAIGTG